jgi:hypothetical protein
MMPDETSPATAEHLIEIARLSLRIQELEGALRPFAEDNWIPFVGLAAITYADHNRARRALPLSPKADK